jgi:hypothetical protein
MPVSFDLPRDIELALRRGNDDLEQAAKEALLVESYRQAKLTHHQLSIALGLSRFETDSLLKRHEVFYDLDAEEVVRESEALGALRADCR